MITKDDIKTAFAYLRAGGSRGGPEASTDPESLATLRLTFQVYEDTLSDWDADKLKRACMAWLRGKDAKWWPTPGDLRSTLPEGQAAALDDSEEVFTKAMNYMMACPPRWVDPQFPNTKLYEPGPGLVPAKYPPPPWPPERHEAVIRATEAMGLEKYTRAEHEIQQNRAKDAWIRAYKTVVKEGALALEGAKVSRLTGPDRRMITAEAK